MRQYGPKWIKNFQYLSPEKPTSSFPNARLNPSLMIGQNHLNETRSVCQERPQ